MRPNKRYLLLKINGTVLIHRLLCPGAITGGVSFRFFDYLPEIRRIIYTASAIESINMSLRKVSKNRGSFPNDEFIIKLFYLALINIAKKWSMPLKDWKPALNRLTIQFNERVPQHY